jgi:hypothetical protein
MALMLTDRRQKCSSIAAQQKIWFAACARKIRTMYVVHTKTSRFPALSELLLRHSDCCCLGMNVLSDTDLNL